MEFAIRYAKSGWGMLIVCIEKHTKHVNYEVQVNRQTDKQRQPGRCIARYQTTQHNGSVMFLKVGEGAAVG